MKSCEWEEYGRKTGREGENGGNRLAGMSEGSPGAERGIAWPECRKVALELKD